MLLINFFTKLWKILKLIILEFRKEKLPELSYEEIKEAMEMGDKYASIDYNKAQACYEYVLHNDPKKVIPEIGYSYNDVKREELGIANGKISKKELRKVIASTIEEERNEIDFYVSLPPHKVKLAVKSTLSHRNGYVHSIPHEDAAYKRDINYFINKIGAKIWNYSDVESAKEFLNNIVRNFNVLPDYFDIDIDRLVFVSRVTLPDGSCRLIEKSIPKRNFKTDKIEGSASYDSDNNDVLYTSGSVGPIPEYIIDKY